MTGRRKCVGLIPVVLGSLLAGAIGCNEPGPVTDAEARQQALALLLPQQVRIEPFTQAALSPTDGMPSELIVYVRAEDQFGDPVKVAGTFNCELYSFKRASGDPKGERIELWHVEVLDREDQVRYWDHTAQMYEFRLQIRHLASEGGPPASGADKAVLLLTYNTPWGEHLEDEYVLDLRAQRRGLAEAEM
ncbi:MAG: hypothetical protein JSU68_01380 [Phycisphaerales bacterium]|nr:MAG: hypothetical protein JSU68_01380 [Phycisphaerales bacterium]